MNYLRSDVYYPPEVKKEERKLKRQVDAFNYFKSFIEEIKDEINSRKSSIEDLSISFQDFKRNDREDCYTLEFLVYFGDEPSYIVDELRGLIEEVADSRADLCECEVNSTSIEVYCNFCF